MVGAKLNGKTNPTPHRQKWYGRGRAGQAWRRTPTAAQERAAVGWGTDTPCERELAVLPGIRRTFDLLLHAALAERHRLSVPGIQAAPGKTMFRTDALLGGTLEGFGGRAWHQRGVVADRGDRPARQLSPGRPGTCRGLAKTEPADSQFPRVARTVWLDVRRTTDGGPGSHRGASRVWVAGGMSSVSPFSSRVSWVSHWHNRPRVGYGR
jgi:hypothetical protein